MGASRKFILVKYDFYLVSPLSKELEDRAVVSIEDAKQCMKGGTQLQPRLGLSVSTVFNRHSLPSIRIRRFAAILRRGLTRELGVDRSALTWTLGSARTPAIEFAWI